jgi:multidrug efflux pump subunit AcrB
MDMSRVSKNGILAHYCLPNFWTRKTEQNICLEMQKKIDAIMLPEGYKIDQLTADIPYSDRKYAMKWDGEWHITYEVFRDLGIAFGVVLILIFVLVVGWLLSFTTPVVIMRPFPSL